MLFEWVHYREGVLVSRTLGRETPTILNVNHLAVVVEFVHIEVEELVKQLSHTLVASLFGHVELLDNLEVALEEGVSLCHTVHLLRRVTVLPIA